MYRLLVSILVTLAYYKPEWLPHFLALLKGEAYNESEKLKSGYEPIREVDQTL